ncbi:GOLPH3/VPS74 family protein [Streptomyces laculatispora]|uniref:GOLPH3/VPS74 family protein n=1 Tax=Streptomyces laculatispora TaxID=887464 RepID=UPI001A94D32F|nr:GPP34 family phosphoprotein [Streptomyces laculatispora]MBO0917102.1 GPP34 family phosphoprotein [Streptomyces laculatispora]
MTPPPPGPTLPEELLLLALDPRRGRPYCGNRSLEYAMAGAALAELSLQGWITEERGLAQVVNPLEPPDPLLATLMRSLPAPGKGRGSGVPARGWVRHAGRQVGGLYLDALVQRGILRRETRRFLGLLPYHRHPVVATDLAGQTRHRFVAAEQAGFPDHRSRALAALVSAADLSRFVCTDRTSRTAMRHLVREQWPAHAVRRNVRRDKADQAGGGG